MQRYTSGSCFDAAQSLTPVTVVNPETPTESSPTKTTDSKEDNSNYITVKSSMIGTFYRSSDPENHHL